MSGSAVADGTKHSLKTRVPRTRLSRSIGGTAEQQEYIFSQPSWSAYPSRRQSIFCSTTKNFEVGTADDGGHNLLMIFPFDVVKIALLDDEDLNVMNVLKGTSAASYLNIDSLFELFDTMFEEFNGTDFYGDYHNATWLQKLQQMKKAFTKNGEFDPTANGNTALAKKYEGFNNRTAMRFKTIVTEIPEKLSPEAWNAKLVTSAALDLPGKQRECWFSGKYLSVPSRYFDEFKTVVKQLGNK